MGRECKIRALTLAVGIFCALSRCSSTNLLPNEKIVIDLPRAKKAAISEYKVQLGRSHIISAPRQINAAALQYMDIFKEFG